MYIYIYIYVCSEATSFHEAQVPEKFLGLSHLIFFRKILIYIYDTIIVTFYEIIQKYSNQEEHFIHTSLSYHHTISNQPFGHTCLPYILRYFNRAPAQHQCLQQNISVHPAFGAVAIVPVATQRVTERQLGELAVLPSGHQ